MRKTTKLNGQATVGHRGIGSLNKVGIKLALAMGLLLGLFVTAALVSLFQTRIVAERFQQVTEVEEPSSAAAYEMEINVNGTGLGVLNYLDIADDRYRQMVIEDEADFLRFKAQAASLSETPQEQELVRRVGLLYQEYRALGGALMDQADRRKHLSATIAHDVEEMDYILDEEIRLRVDPQGADGLAKITAALHMEANAYELTARLGHYLENPEPQYQGRLVEDAGEFREEMAQFRTLALSEQEMGHIAEVEERFGRVWASVQETVLLREGMARDLDRFLALRASLDDLLDEEIQVLTHRDLTAAATTVDETVRRTNTMVFALLMAGLIAGAFTVLVITSSVTRPVAGLVRAMRAVGAGDLSQRVAVRSGDEFCFLGQAFNDMVAVRQVEEEARRQAHDQLTVEMHHTQRVEKALQQAHDQLELRVQERTTQLAQANQTITGINEVTRTIASTLDVGQVYGLFAQGVKKLVDYDRMAINLVDHEAGKLIFKYASGVIQPGRQVGDRVSLAGTQTQCVVETGQPLTRPDIAADLRFLVDETYLQVGLRSQIMMPLIVKGKVVATFNLCSRQIGAYGPREQEILEQVAAQVASAFENARLYEEVQERTEELAWVNKVITGINEVTQIITSTLDINQVYEEFAQKAKNLVDFDRISVSVIDGDAGTFTFKYVTGLSAPGRNPGDSMPVAGSQLEKAILTGRSQVRDDGTAGSGVSAVLEMARVGVRSSILVPLVAKGEVIGGLGLWSCRSGAYGPREQEILGRLAAQIAPTVENARLYQEAAAEKERATTALAQLNAVLESVDAGIVLVGEDNQTVLWANRKMGEFIGADDLTPLFGNPSCAEEMGRLLRPLLERPEEFFAEIERIYQDQSYVGVTENIQLSGPQKRVVRQFTAPVHGSGGQYLARLWVITDVTERQRLEAQFRQSQKMEVVGRLAGGVAHDFNNLLTAILGYTQLASAQLPAEHPVSGHLQEVEKATQRAVNLTGQLLTFSRHQAVVPAMADLNQITMEMHGMLRRLIGENVELVTLPAPDLPPVKVDQGQMGQLVMNLVVNGRDAMPSGGKITIATAGVLLGDQQAAKVEGVSPGRYVTLSITDTGTGMSDEVKAHLFEPFFTTKEVGKGTGLGLATCYGIVRRAGGHIEVESQLGQGTTFRIYLPAESSQDVDGSGKQEAQDLPWGTETVLLTEDEPALRALVSQTLEDLGYTVLQATDGEEALRVAQEHRGGPIHLLLTDMVMPKLGGVELASRFKAEWPGARVLFVSGYSEEPFLQHSAGRRDLDFVQKPFLPAVLARRVRELLDR